MTENDIKEALSKVFVSSLANYSGIIPSTPAKDYGEDLLLQETTTRIENGATRHVNSGRSLSIQLKSTTESSIQFDTDHLKFVLEAKTYNDLIDRRHNSYQPLFLILLILPDDKQTWLSVAEEELILRKSAFWFIPADTDIATTNTSSITISIPKRNQLSLDSFAILFDLAYNI